MNQPDALSSQTDHNQDKSPLLTLRKHFGFHSFRQGQLEVILATMSGKDTMVLWATGSGKSITFQLPAIHTQNVVIVVSPLLSLIADQVKAVNTKFGQEIAASFASTDLTPHLTEKIHAGQVLLLYTTPESMQSDFFWKNVTHIHQNIRPILLLAVDEAHFLSTQGFDFRPSFREIKNFRTHFPTVPIMALTATAPKHIRDDIVRTLEMRSPLTFSGSYDRPNLTINIHIMNRKLAIAEIVKQCSKPFAGSAIVYTFTRRDAELLHEKISQKAKTKEAQSCQVYHGQVDYSTRENVQRWFNTGTIKLVIATGSSFGTGIDKGDIQNIWLFTLPKNFEEFYQQIGRAGRNGQPANIHAYIGRGDFMMHLRREKTSNKTHLAMQKAEKRSLFCLRDMCMDRKTCRRWAILQYWKENTPEFACGNCDNCRRKLSQQHESRDSV